MLADMFGAMTAVQPLFDITAVYSQRKSSGHHSTTYAAVHGFACLRDSTVQELNGLKRYLIRAVGLVSTLAVSSQPGCWQHQHVERVSRVMGCVLRAGHGTGMRNTALCNSIVSDKFGSRSSSKLVFARATVKRRQDVLDPRNHLRWCNLQVADCTNRFTLRK
jgi:hypothetical protein